MGEVDINITDHVNAILDGSIDNHGFIMISSDEMDEQFEYCFGSAENSDKSLRPKLTVEFTSSPISPVTKLNSSLFSITKTESSLIISSSKIKEGTISLISINGKTVLKRSMNSGFAQLKRDHIPAGIYLINIYNATESYSKKLNIFN